jgi:hypothetical protein
MAVFLAGCSESFYYFYSMTLYQFNSLDEMEQAETLWDKGVHIAEREDDIHKFILYQIDSFYVEVWHHKEYNVIRKLRTFSSASQLDPYLPIHRY